jgi:hypothetical protein
MRVRDAIAGVRHSCAVTAAVQEYSRVIPVLAGQVREGASHIEQTREAFQHLRDRDIGHARRSIAAAASMEDAISALKVISLRLDQGTQDVDAIRRLVADLERSLTRAMNALRHSAESDAEAAQENALFAEDRAERRLQNVIETLSEMQDEFVAALDRPQKRPAPAGAAALRLRQRYTATAAPQ